MSVSRDDARPAPFRELVRIALPLVASAGAQTLMMVIDRIFLTWHSQEALAAALPAALVHWTFLSLAIGTAQYVNTFVAQYHGAGQPERVAASIWQGVHFSVWAGLAMIGLYPLADPIFQAIGHEPAVAVLEAQYFALLSFCGLPALLAATLSCFYSGRGQTLPILWITMASVVTNIVLDYLLIFGKGGLPALGIEGAALATVAANGVGLVLYAAALLQDPALRAIRGWTAWRVDPELFGRLMRYGLPSGVHLLMDVLCFELFILLIGRLGTQELAATNLAFNLNTLAFVPMLGLGTAVMTIVGQRIGEGRPQWAVRTTWLAFALSMVYMSSFAVLYVTAPDWILRPYQPRVDPARFETLRERTVVLLRFVALYSLFDTMSIVFGSAVRGAGDTRFSLWFTTSMGWLVMVVPTYVAVGLGKGGLLAAWVSVTAYSIVLGIGFLARFLQGQWKRMAVIEQVASVQPRPAAVALT